MRNKLYQYSIIGLLSIIVETLTLFLRRQQKVSVIFRAVQKMGFSQQILLANEI